MSDKQQPDTKKGSYYVSVIDGSRYVLALGPFINDHQAALDRVDAVRDYVRDHDPRGHFYSFGTARTDSDRPGKLNAILSP